MRRSAEFDGTELVGSAPVEAATTASVAVLNSLISGSRSDEDIILRDDATIDYQNSQGHRWHHRCLDSSAQQRTLTTNIPRGSLDVYDMGWGAADWNDLTDENGNVVLVEDGPTNEHKRIVAWMDGNGVVHQEEASITLSIESSWGVFSTTIDTNDPNGHHRSRASVCCGDGRVSGKRPRLCQQQRARYDHRIQHRRCSRFRRQRLVLQWR